MEERDDNIDSSDDNVDITDGGKEKKIHWLDALPTACPTATVEEIYNFLRKGKTPVKNPHLLKTIGIPGAGKSTVSKYAIEFYSIHPYDSYIILDVDSIMDEFKDPINKINGVKIGLKYQWDQCVGRFVDPIFDLVLDKIFSNKYNIILQSHEWVSLFFAFNKGYTTTMLYVKADVHVAIKRTKLRAEVEGRFITNGTKNDSWGWENSVNFYHKFYQMRIPFIAMMAYNFIYIDNNKENTTYKKENFIAIDIHATPWKETMDKLYDLIQ